MGSWCCSSCRTNNKWLLVFYVTYFMEKNTKKVKITVYIPLKLVYNNIIKLKRELQMGIHIGPHNRSSSWIGRFDPKNSQDMLEYEMVKSIVRACNSPNRKFRVEKKGRKPTKGFNFFGDPVGGIKNATLWDVYVYRKTYDYYNQRRIG